MFHTCHAPGKPAKTDAGLTAVTAVRLIAHRFIESFPDVAAGKGCWGLLRRIGADACQAGSTQTGHEFAEQAICSIGKPAA